MLIARVRTSTGADAQQADVAGSDWPEGGRTNQVQVRFTPEAASPYMVALYELQAVEVRGDLERAAAVFPHSGQRPGLARRS